MSKPMYPALLLVLLAMLLACKSFRLNTGDVTVTFPAAFKTDTAVENGHDGQVKLFGAVAETYDCDYSLLVVSCPPSLLKDLVPDLLLKNSIITVVGRMQGNLGEIADAVVQGRPAKRYLFTLNDKKSKGEGYTFLHGNDVIMIDGLYSLRPSKLDRFYKSLKLNGNA